MLQVLGGAVLWTLAETSYTQTELRGALDRLVVQDVMIREVVHVRPDMAVAELVEQFWLHHFTSFPVVAEGAGRGIASLRHLDTVPRERWPLTRVAASWRR